MARVEHVNHWWRLVLVALFAGIFLPLVGMTAIAHAEDGPGHGGGPGDGHEFRGIVEVIPENRIGEWTISGKQYKVTEQTEITDQYGTIAVDSCVVGEMSSDNTYVRELKSAREYACKQGADDNGGDNGGSNQGRGELYAKLVSFPDGLIGEWVIGTLTFTADANTEFSEKNGPFTVDEYVKVEFVVLQDNSLLAKEIKTVALPHDDGDDDGPDHGPGHGHGEIEHQAVAFGAIETIPDGGAEGVWQIGGITYTVTISTELATKNGVLEVGQNARVKYLLDDNGNRVAKQIKSMPPAAGGTPQWELRVVGFVEAMPPEADGFIGNWTVAGVELVADANSKFDEEDGVIDVGTFVKVKYRMDGTTRVIVEMESHVMPGGGDNDHIGECQSMDDNATAAAVGAAATTWQIDGRSYVVTDATMVGSVAVGDTVLVNSYTDASGAQVATRITNVTLDNLLFLPAAAR